MVSLKGPLMSLDASGTIAGTITFSKWKGRNYARSTVIPANPQTDLQTAVRAVLAFVSKDFANLSEAQKDEWHEVASALAISAINAYTGNAVKAARQESGWPRYPSAAPAQTPGAASNVQVSVGFRQVKITFTQPAQKPNYAWLIYIIAQPAEVRQFAALTKVTYPNQSEQTVSVTITNLDPGQYKLNIRGMNEDGELGPFMEQDVAFNV